MRDLKLTVLIEPGVKSELMNVFGTDFNIVGKNLKYMQYSFPDIKILTAFKLRPIIQLLETFEGENGSLRFKMLHLKDDVDGSYSPVYIQCSRGVWSLVTSNGGVEQKSSDSLFNLI